MGYECGFYSINRRIINNGFNPEIDNLSEYIYKTKQEIKEAVENQTSWHNIISYSTLKNIYHKDGYGYDSIVTDYDYWCSIGRYIYSFLTENKFIEKRKTDDAHYILEKDDLIKIVCSLNKYIFKENNIKHYDIANGINYDFDTEECRLTPINGIEFRNVDTGEYNRIISVEEEDDFVYLDMSFDIDGVYTQLLSCICEMLEKVDFENEVVIFWESY